MPPNTHLSKLERFSEGILSARSPAAICLEGHHRIEMPPCLRLQLEERYVEGWTAFRIRDNTCNWDFNSMVPKVEERMCRGVTCLNRNRQVPVPVTHQCSFRHPSSDHERERSKILLPFHGIVLIMDDGSSGSSLAALASLKRSVFTSFNRLKCSAEIAAKLQFRSPNRAGRLGRRAWQTRQSRQALLVD